MPASAALVALAAACAAAGVPDFSARRPKGPRRPMPPMPATAPAAPDVQFGGFKPFNDVDRFILARLQEETRKPKPRPGPTCDDWEFLRRSSLDLAGVIPDADAVATFNGWKKRDRRDRWIDHLLEQQQYADHWTIFWGDLLGERSDARGIPPNAFRRYIHDNLRRNRPFDEWVREMIAAEGESEQVPATGLLLSKAEFDRRQWANALTVSTSQVFLGVQLKCAECHDHPSDWWTQRDFEGMAGFFGGARRNRYRMDEGMERGRRREMLRFELLERPRRADGVFCTGETSSLGRGRQALAELITRPDNPYFARVTVNRLWQKLMGAGLVNPVDALGPLNPPSHPELLDWLAVEFVSSGYDLKHVLRLIAGSRTYQQSSAERPSTYKPPRLVRDPTDEEVAAGSLFNAMPLRRMTAEQFYDSLLVATGRYAPDDSRFEPSIRVDYPPRPDSFLRTFGASDRMTLLPRDPSETVQQALALLNGGLINEAVKLHDEHPVRLWRKRGFNNAQIIEALFVQFLTRPPTRDEARWAAALFANGQDDARWEDLQWALLNAREFQFIK